MSDCAPTVCVITAATGHPQLLRCLQSVQAQTLATVEHFVVIDGPEHAEKVNGVIDAMPRKGKPIKRLQLPEATGKNDWLCHRIYGATPFLVSTPWVCFLDEDNWFDDDHIESLMDAVIDNDVTWGFSLRKIVDKVGNFIELDQCESLGLLHPVFHREDVWMVDTNCYLLQRDLAIKYCSIWNRPRHPEKGMPADFTLCMALLASKVPATTNRRHTMNYTVSSDPKSNNAEFFELGNSRMRDRYPQGMPWLTT